MILRVLNLERDDPNLWWAQIMLGVVAISVWIGKVVTTAFVGWDVAAIVIWAAWLVNAVVGLVRTRRRHTPTPPRENDRPGRAGRRLWGVRRRAGRAEGAPGRLDW